MANCNVRNVRQQSQYEDEFFVENYVRARAKAKANGRRQDVCGKMSEKQGHHRITYTQCVPKGSLLTSF